MYRDIFDSFNIFIVIAAAPRYIASAQTAQKTPFPTVLLLLHESFGRTARETPSPVAILLLYAAAAFL
jgi:hypothetical protein